MTSEDDKALKTFIDTASPDRPAVARRLSDARLLHYYDRLHHPDFVDDLWVPILEAEILRRGLRRPS